MKLIEIVKDGMMIANWHGWAYICFKIVTQSNLFGFGDDSHFNIIKGH